MREQFTEDRDELVFLLVVAAFTVWAYVETLSFLPTSATVPQIILYLIGGALVMIFVMKLWGEEIKAKLGLEGTNAGFDLGAGDEQEDQISGLYEINPLGVTHEMIWILAYVLGVMYVGFFTVSAAFSLAYILINETSDLRRRIPLAIVWTSAIMGILYLLFIRFLQVSSVWRLGFLP